MDNAYNRIGRNPSSSSTRSPSYGGSDGPIYQNNQHVGKSVDSLVGIPQIGLQESTSPATTIRQGLSVQELKAMTARRMATSEMVTSPKSGLTSSYGTANPEQLQKAQIGLEIAAPQNRPLQAGRDRDPPYAMYNNPLGAASQSLYSSDPGTIRPPLQKFNTQPNFQHRGGYQPDPQSQPQFQQQQQQQQQQAAREIYLGAGSGGGGAMQRTVGNPQSYTAAGAAASAVESPFYNRLLRSNTEGVGEQPQNKLRLPNAASAIISGGPNPSRRGDGSGGGLISSHTRQLMDMNFSSNGRLNASLPIESSLATLEIFGDSGREGGAAFRGGLGQGGGGGSVSLPLLAGPGDGAGGSRSSLLGQPRFGAEEEAAGRENYFAQTSVPRISGSGSGSGSSGSVLSPPPARRQSLSQSEVSSLHEAVHFEHPQYMLGRQASQSRLHDSPHAAGAGTGAGTGFVQQPLMSRQASNPHLQTDHHLLQRSLSADRNFDLPGGGGGGGDYLMSSRHHRMVRQETAMQPWLEEAEAEDMYSPTSSTKERDRDSRSRDRDRERGREEDREQGQFLGLGLTGSSAARSDGERRLDPLARPPLQPPPGLSTHTHSHPNPNPISPLPTGMVKVKSSSRLPVPGLLAPLDSHSVAALTYSQKTKRVASSSTVNNLSEDDSDDRSLPDMASPFFDFTADSNHSSNPSYFPHAASTSPLSFFGGRLTAAQRTAAAASFHRDTPDSQAAESDDDNSILRALGQRSISYGSELSGAGSAQPFYQHNPHPNPHHHQQHHHHQQQSQSQQLFGRAAAGELDGPSGLMWSGSRLMSGAYGSPDQGQGQGPGQGLRRLSRYPHTDELE
eukprot:gene24697-33169_t